MKLELGALTKAPETSESHQVVVQKGICGPIQADADTTFCINLEVNGHQVDNDHDCWCSINLSFEILR